MKHGKSAISRKVHRERDILMERIPHGRGVNRRISVTLVPELRKPRSKRDPVLLAQQIEAAKPLAHKLKGIWKRVLHSRFTYWLHTQ